MKDKSGISVNQLEEDIFEMEEIRIVIRKPKYSVLDNAKLYHELYERKVSGIVPIRRWVLQRLAPYGLSYDDVEIIMNGVFSANPNSPIEQVRDSYITK